MPCLVTTKLALPHRVVLVVLIQLSALVAAGCFGGSDWAACEKATDVELQVISPDGEERVYTDEAEGATDVQVEYGEDLVVSVDHGSCPKPDAYRWTLKDRYTEVSEPKPWNEEPQPQPWDEGGFGKTYLNTTSETVALKFPHVGSYYVDVDFFDGDGNIHEFWGEGRLHVHVGLQLSELLLTDGSSYTAEFSSFCCPYNGEVQISPQGTGMVPVDWEASFVVKATDEVVWRGRSGQLAGNEFTDLLGYQWLEVIEFRVDPPETAPASILQERYQVEMIAGPPGYWQPDG